MLSPEMLAGKKLTGVMCTGYSHRLMCVWCVKIAVECSVYWVRTVFVVVMEQEGSLRVSRLDPSRPPKAGRFQEFAPVLKARKEERHPSIL